MRVLRPIHWLLYVVAVGVAALLVAPYTTILRGDDWITWQDSEQGIIATQIHPLYSQNTGFSDKIQPSDILTQIDYQPIYQAADAQQMSHSAAPATVFIYGITRPQAALATQQAVNLFVVNGYRLPFSFMQLPIYFRVEPWLHGALLFLAGIMLLILLPILRSDLKIYGTVLGLLVIVMALFSSTLFQYFYELIEKNAATKEVLQLFSLLRTFLLLAYGGMMWLNSQTRRSVTASIIGSTAIVYLLFQQIADWQTDAAEHIAMMAWLMLPLPAAEASATRLQFGRISLIITQTIQYIIIFSLGMLTFLALGELVENWLSTATYRLPLIAGIFLGVAVLARLIYTANADRFRRYFTTQQHARAARFRQFIARIPQYTAKNILFNDIISEIQVFCGAADVHIFASNAPALAEQHREMVYEALAQKHAIWAANKELSPFVFAPTIEKDLVAADIGLIFPIISNEEEKYVLTLDRKKRGVYNLSEIETIGELVRQTQLTLSVLQLVGKQQDLLRQTYEANLTALRSQINPHFLFNTLNTISALIHDSPEQAEAATEQLAYIFRYTLRNSDKDFVPLEDELSLVRAYLAIEKSRFGDRLASEITYAPDTRSVQMPAFVLQTFVENCIKHGIAKIVEKGIISIICEKEITDTQSYLRCEITDNGVGIDTTRIFSSTGLKNVVSRIETLYGRRDLLVFENLSAEGTRGTRVTLRLPIQ